MSEENKAVARRFLEAQAKGDMETLDELMAPNFADRSLLPGQKASREDYKHSLADMLAVFSNTSFAIEAQIAEGDQVVSRYKGTSVHRGHFLGVAPTGQETSYSGITIHRISEGKIIEEWGESDNLEVVQPAFEQEVRRRKTIEQEKMAALGKLSAGLAHELNNPAAAARRAAQGLQEVTTKAQLLTLEHASRLSPERREALVSVLRDTTANINVIFDSLALSDREEEIADWLEERGAEDAWELAPILAAASLDSASLEKLVAGISDSELIEGILRWLAATLEVTDLADKVERSAGRISELVQAVKVYTSMDRAPYVQTDVREGLENTLRILGHKLNGVVVERDYEEDLPKIWARAGELNQVWANLIDNAADALGGQGQIRVRASRDGDGVGVEIVDDGPGIPLEIQTQIFDPFFTTKEVGKGTGLGLDIVRRAVADHGGVVSVDSKSGHTHFTVRLPQESPQSLG